ncbi:hypothetical protein F4827_005990 [Paraburkholderia bannensis]|uniref:Filamentous hemagglutinin n=2 Tax=Burkholderiaceae TaxID=119060 RepID=A0A7W9U393_9BURK|nr:hypothetical protein [Paraburkholderia sp. WP4_3_2]MBB6106119.1 hypothetical protein [Paraburkholderia bannensis]
MSKAHGNANSDSAIANNTHINAGNSVTILSGGDTNIIGANVNARQVNADIGGDLNIASVQDTMTSAAHQESSGGGFSVSQGGASGSFSSQHGDASGNYAGVNEQAGIQAGDGGFNVNVKGNTDLKGATIASTADAANNNLSTGTLTFSDIQNSSSYNAHSGGIGGGVTMGDGGSNYATHGSTSGSNTGGVAPMLSQNDSGSDSATTRSAISAGTISVTDAAHQTQDVTSLSRDATNTNGTVAKTPDVNNMLNQQADTMRAAQAAGQVVSQGIGAYADKKRDDAADAYDAAKQRGDSEGMAAAEADYNNWKEGGDSRAELHAAGGSLIGGLGGGTAFSTVGGAAGAGIASRMAETLNDISKGVASATGSDLIGNLAANIAAGVGGAAVGGTAGAAMASNVHLYNQSVDDERALSGDPARKTTSLFSLAMQGIANGLSAIVGMGGGGPPASPGMAMAQSSPGPAANVASGLAGSLSNIAIFNSGNDVKSGVPGSDFTPSPDVTGPYVRPSGAGPNAAQKASVQGKPCVDCGTVTGNQVADHIDPLVVQYYRDGAVDVPAQSSVDAVQPHCPTCSAVQGGQLGAFGKMMRNYFGF